MNISGPGYAPAAVRSSSVNRASEEAGQQTQAAEKRNSAFRKEDAAKVSLSPKALAQSAEFAKAAKVLESGDVKTDSAANAPTEGTQAPQEAAKPADSKAGEAKKGVDQGVGQVRATSQAEATDRRLKEVLG
jgi:hypothetical protein